MCEVYKKNKGEGAVCGNTFERGKDEDSIWNTLKKKVHLNSMGGICAMQLNTKGEMGVQCVQIFFAMCCVLLNLERVRCYKYFSIIILCRWYILQ